MKKAIRSKMPRLKQKLFKISQKPLLIVIVISILTVSTGASIFSYKKGKLPFIAKKDNVTQLTPPPSSALIKESQQEVLGTNKSEDKTEKISPTLIPTPLPTQTIVVEQPKIDSAVGIEMCRSQAKEKRKEEERKVNEEYAQSEPAIVELAAAQNNSQTETAALKYGIITQSDVVRRTEVFEELISQGVPIDQAGKVAEDAGNDYSTYLRSLHDWAENELNKWYSAATSSFDTYENEVFQSCLSSL